MNLRELLPLIRCVAPAVVAAIVSVCGTQAAAADDPALTPHPGSASTGTGSAVDAFAAIFERSSGSADRLLNESLLRFQPVPSGEAGAEEDREELNALAPSDLAIPSAAPFGTSGSWRWALYGGVAFDIEDDNEQYNTTFAASYFLADDITVDFELGGLFFDDESGGRRSQDAIAANFNLIFRWHFLVHERWTLYAEGGAGVLLATEEFPRGGTNFNFTPQGGLGVSIELPDSEARLMTGIRWHHISNARINGEDDNPGRNAIMFYTGVSFPW